MCGIAGFLDASCATGADDLRSTARKMADTLWHRGPDDQGVWVDENRGIALGFRRLAILDLSPEGHQPMISPGGRFVVVFNGEIYNHLELRRELERDGAAGFRGHSDTEVLLAAVERWGIESAVRRFVGMYAFAVWDRTECRLHLVRDRVGEKPLYYGWLGDHFVFGSELKALRSHPGFCADVSRQSLALYLRMRYVPEPFSIYNNIYKLQPGSILTLHRPTVGHVPASTSYWDACAVVEQGEAERFVGNPEDAAAQFEDLLRESVRRQMVADVPLGAFLSGGIDSSLVVALMQSQSSQRVKTFTIGFHDPRFNEANHAKSVSEHLGTEHTELYVTPTEAMLTIPRLPSLFDEPLADSSQIPTYLVAQLARTAVTVSLSGDGGDELFAGYQRYRSIYRAWSQTGWIPRCIRQSLGFALACVPIHAWDRTLGMVRIVLKRGFNSLDGQRIRHLLRDVSQCASAEGFYFQRLYPNTSGLVLDACHIDSMHSHMSRVGGIKDLANRFSVFDFLTYLPGDILTKVDRATMGVSLESRAPFLDHRIVEFAFRLSSDIKWHEGQPKWILRRVLSKYVPQQLFDRPKMGFGIPLGDWMRGSLRDWAEDLLDERRLREQGLLNGQLVRRKWLEHLTGSADWGDFLWRILIFEGWLHSSTGAVPSVIDHAPSV